MKEIKIDCLDNKKESKESFFDLLYINEKEGKKYIFRGQANHQWKLESSYKRALKIKNLSIDNIYNDFEKLIDRIKNLYKINKSNLEIISEMQHYGLKTFLIDFTSDIYNALWFAINDEDNIDEDFAIFTFEISEEKLIKKEIDFKKDIYKNDVYFCPINLKRGIAQKSYFIIDSNILENSENIKKWVISKSLKSEIEKIIENRNISSISIFPDLKGIYKEAMKIIAETNKKQFEINSLTENDFEN